MSQGHTGFLSDRAFEMDVRVKATAPLPPPVVALNPPPLPFVAASTRAERAALVDLHRRVRAVEAAPMFFERAWVQLEKLELIDGGAEVGYSARISNLVRLGGPPELAYRDAPGLRFRWRPPGATLASPRYEALAGDGVLRVAAVFGQMRPDAPLDQDEGTWSRDAFVGGLQGAGYALADDPQRPGAQVWLRAGPLRVEVEVHGPDEFPVEGRDEQASAELRGALGRSEVFYLNGHTRLPAFDPLTDPSAHSPPRHRLLVLDLCWSYFDYARPVLDAAPDAQVVSTDGRVVTGSVGSFDLLLGALVDGAEARDAAPTPWLPLLGAMNDLAQQRADERRGRVEDRMEPPEVYGVSPTW